MCQAQKVIHCDAPMVRHREESGVQGGYGVTVGGELRKYCAAMGRYYITQTSLVKFYVQWFGGMVWFTVRVGLVIWFCHWKLFFCLGEDEAVSRKDIFSFTRSSFWHRGFDKF